MFHRLVAELECASGQDTNPDDPYLHCKQIPKKKTDLHLNASFNKL